MLAELVISKYLLKEQSRDLCNLLCWAVRTPCGIADAEVNAEVHAQVLFHAGGSATRGLCEAPAMLLHVIT